MSADPTPRAQPFYCPYCGEQDLRPADGAGSGSGYHCLVCDRLWELTYSGLDEREGKER